MFSGKTVSQYLYFWKDLSPELIFTLIFLSDGHPGREFVLGFLQNRIILDYPVARIYISTAERTTVFVSISVPGTGNGRLWKDTGNEGSHGQVYSVTLLVTAGHTVMHQLPYEIHMVGNKQEMKGANLVHINENKVESKIYS